MRRTWMENPHHSFSAFTFFMMMLLGGCETPESRREYLARVGDSYLTPEEIVAAVDTTITSSDPRIQQYVWQWVNNEMLYQEARRQGMENSETVQRQLVETRRQLSIEAFLRKEIYGDTIQIPEDSIMSYYRTHTEEFLMRDDAVKVNMIGFTTREKASAFRTKVLSGTPWDEAARILFSDIAGQSFVIARVDAKYYTQRTLFPPELWRVAVNLFPREVSFPVRTPGGFFVIQSLHHLRRGTRAEFDMVRDEIRQRFILERRRERYSDLLDRLRSRYEVEIAAP